MNPITVPSLGTSNTSAVKEIQTDRQTQHYQKNEWGRGNHSHHTGSTLSSSAVSLCVCFCEHTVQEVMLGSLQKAASQINQQTTFVVMFVHFEMFQRSHSCMQKPEETDILLDFGAKGTLNLLSKINLPLNVRAVTFYFITCKNRKQWDSNYKTILDCFNNSSCRALQVL